MIGSLPETVCTKQCTTGDVKYVDVNHDGVIDAKDKVDLGNGLPKYTFGFNINLGYKGFDLSLNATGAGRFPDSSILS